MNIPNRNLKQNLLTKRGTFFVKCIICGRESEDKICGRCFVERFRIAELEKFELELCSKCGAIRFGRDWKNIGLSEALKFEILKNLKLNPEFRIKEIKLNDSILIKGEIKGEEVELTLPLSYRIHRISCPRCTRESGGYYEAIVQIRAGRKLREGEIERIIEIVRSILQGCEGEKDFLSKFETFKYGMDFYFGSRKIGEKVSKRVLEEFGGRIFESKKLHSRMDGQDIFRFTFLVRLPEYEEGDVVIREGRIYIVKSARLSKGVEIFSGKTANITNSVVIAKRDSMKWGVITDLDENIAEVMDEDGRVFAVSRPFNAKVGGEVFIFEYRGKFYAFPIDL